VRDPGTTRALHRGAEDTHDTVLQVPKMLEMLWDFEVGEASEQAADSGRACVHALRSMPCLVLLVNCQM
jgi:hypothetical protein